MDGLERRREITEWVNFRSIEITQTIEIIQKKREKLKRTKALGTYGTMLENLKFMASEFQERRKEVAKK